MGESSPRNTKSISYDVEYLCQGPVDKQQSRWSQKPEFAGANPARVNMPNTNDEYTSVPGNAIGAKEYPSTMLQQANELQKIQDRLLKKQKVVNSKSFKSPVMVPAPYTAQGSHQFATEDFFRHKLITLQEFRKSRYKSIKL